MKEFWNNFCSWWNSATMQRISLTYKDIMLGFDLYELPAPLNSCLLYAKFYVFRCCVQKTKPSFPIFLQYVKQQFHMEQPASFQSGNITAINAKWHPLKDFFSWLPPTFSSYMHHFSLFFICYHLSFLLFL